MSDERGRKASLLARDRLDAAIEAAASRPEVCALDPARDFTRDRKITLADCLRLLVTWGTQALDSEIGDLFGWRADAPSASAVCQRRRRLSDDAMPLVHAEFLRRWDVVPYLGRYRLLAADGTAVPFCGDGDEATRVANGNGSGSRGTRAELHPTMSYDVARRTFEGVVMQGSGKQNEPAALCELVDRTWPGRAPDGTRLRALWLADCNYSSYNVMCHMAEAGASFCMRANDQRAARLLWKGSTKMPEAELDEDRDIILTRSEAKWTRSTEGRGAMVRRVARGLRLDVLPPRSRAKVEYGLHVRVVRVALPPGGDPDVEDGDGEPWLNLFTDLPRDEFPPERLRELYRRRWTEELAFRDLKLRVGCRSPKTRDPRQAAMEVWGRVVLHNVCSLGISDVPEPPRGSKHERRTDRSVGFQAMLRLIRKARAARSGVDVEGFCGRRSHSARDGRSAPRNKRKQPPPCLTYQS